MSADQEIRSEESLRTEYIDLPVTVLRRDGQTDSRTHLNPKVIQEYAQLILDGIVLPPVRACFDGKNYWLTDGFHRVAAIERAGHQVISVEVFRGTISEAQWDSYSANAKHGVRRTSADLKVVIGRALRHDMSAKLTNCELARHLHVSEKTTRRFRHTSSSAHAEDERIATRKGQQYKLNTANIGKTRQRSQHQDRPDGP
jgi:hypothetical protein